MLGSDEIFGAFRSIFRCFWTLLVSGKVPNPSPPNNWGKTSPLSLGLNRFRRFMELLTLKKLKMDTFKLQSWTPLNKSNIPAPWKKWWLEDDPVLLVYFQGILVKLREGRGKHFRVIGVIGWVLLVGCVCVCVNAWWTWAVCFWFWEGARSSWSMFWMLRSLLRLGVVLFFPGLWLALVATGSLSFALGAAWKHNSVVFHDIFTKSFRSWWDSTM